jgi:hypothetical protein
VKVKVKKLLSHLSALDLVALAGSAAMIFGVAEIHRPSAWILGGVMCLAAAAFGAWPRHQ